MVCLFIWFVGFHHFQYFSRERLIEVFEQGCEAYRIVLNDIVERSQREGRSLVLSDSYEPPETLSGIYVYIYSSYFSTASGVSFVIRFMKGGVPVVPF